MDTKTYTDVLHELIDNVESVGIASTRDDWPDMYETYLKALSVLGLPQQIVCDECGDYHLSKEMTEVLFDGATFQLCGECAHDYVQWLKA